MAGIILLGSLMAVVYVWKVVEVAYFQEYIGDLEVKEVPLSLLIPTWTLVAANIYFGLDATLTVGVATRAAELLLGVSP